MQTRDLNQLLQVSRVVGTAAVAAWGWGLLPILSWSGSCRVALLGGWLVRSAAGVK
jgi:hypothetical protein